MNGNVDSSGFAASSHMSQALKHMQALALPSMSSNLSHARSEIAELLQNLRRLDYLREIAAGVLRFYEQASDVDAATFSVARRLREGSQHDDALLVTYCSVLPGGLPDEQDPTRYAEELIRNLPVRHGSWVPSDAISRGAGVFADDVSSFYVAATGTDWPGVYTMPTSRAIVLAAADSSGVDGVARTLCPEAWKAVSKHLAMPALEGRELLDMRLTALAVASLFDYAQSLSSARLVARRDNASPDSPWTLWINDVVVDDFGTEAPQVLCGRLMMEMRNPDHAWPAELHLLKNNVSALVGACGGAEPEPEVEFHVDRSTVMQHFPEAGPAGSDRLAQALLPQSWAAIEDASISNEQTTTNRPRPR
jgi:hypothetical protein